MSAILIRPNNKYYVIDVVRKISRGMPVQITTNPVETGEDVSDHVILQNKTFTIEGVISDANLAWFDDNRVPAPLVKVDDATVVVTPNPGSTTINVKTNRPVGRDSTGAGATSFTSRLKDIANNQLGFITQFTTDPLKVETSISGSSSKPNTVAVVNATPVERAYDKYQLLEKMRDDREVIELSHSIGNFPNLIIKDVQVDRDSNISARSFVFTLELEQVQIVSQAKTVAIAKLPKPSPKPKSDKVDICEPKKDTGKGSPVAAGTNNPAATDAPPLKVDVTLLDQAYKTFL